MSKFVYDTFRSLRHRNFLLYCTGIIASLTGTWMQLVAIGWVAYQLTGSTLVLGAVSFANLVPTITLSLLGGTVAGRFNRRNILLATQTFAALQATLLLVLTWTGAIQVWHLVALSAALGASVAFELPARFAMIPEMVEGDEVLNAFSLDSFIFYFARAAGPAIGGVLLGLWGAVAVFAINVATYAFELCTLLLIRYKNALPASARGSVREALRFYWSPRIRNSFLLVSLGSFTAVYLAFMPKFTDIVHGSASDLGLLVAASEVGALLASLWLARVKNAATLDRAIGWNAVVLAIALAAFAYSQNLVLSALLLAPIGWTLTTLVMGGHGIVQTTAPDELRGLISSIFWMLVLGLQSCGALALGVLAQGIGLPASFAAAAGVTAVCAVIYLRSVRSAVIR
jgi:MFS family permease